VKKIIWWIIIIAVAAVVIYWLTGGFRVEPSESDAASRSRPNPERNLVK